MSLSELVMLTRNNGVSCLFISAQAGNLDAVKALLEAGGRELVMMAVEVEPAASLSHAGKTRGRSAWFWRWRA